MKSAEGTQTAGRRAGSRREPYLGSVRFFKHMILAVLALLILVPTVCCVVLAAQRSALRRELAAQIQAQAPQSGGGEAAESAEPQVSPGKSAPPVYQADVPAYTRLYPELYAKARDSAPVSQSKTVYLTFDDGPSAHTPEILEILRQYDVKATFFVVGRTDEQSIAWMRQIVAEGHTLGIHSYSHEYTSVYASVEAYLEDFDRLYVLLRDQVGVEPQIFRFPGGSINGYNSGTWRGIVAEMVRRGFVYFDWNVSAEDAVQGAPRSADQIAANCLASVDTLNRAVILLHDGGVKKTTVEALPQIIAGYRDAGFSFAPLTEDVKPVIFAYPK